MSLIGYLFGASAEQKRSDELDAKVRAGIERDFGPGGKDYNTLLTGDVYNADGSLYIPPEPAPPPKDGAFAADKAYQASQAHLAIQQQQDANIDQQYNDAFDSGLQDGYNNITGGINATLKAPFKFAFASIPWQIYVVGIGLAFFYLGGFTWLKGILAKSK